MGLGAQTAQRLTASLRCLSDLVSAILLSWIGELAFEEDRSWSRKGKGNITLRLANGQRKVWRTMITTSS
ncbi:hypothetical protein CC2G_003121 [Coprinopsis cinerea AmutBmut pab1-1]|nr:hypothetical protein CC2G_003121 [Coprinopsis cinerea AmutBmut pab1-1]